MRKRMFVGGIALCLALSVAGCGKSSEEQQAVNYYQDELGLDREEAEELAHEIYGEDEEDEEEPSVTEETPEEIVVEPLPELVNSEWYECKVQIYDMVFTRGETEEGIRKIVEGSAYDVELMEDFDENGNVCLEGIRIDGDGFSFLKENTTDGDYYTFGSTFLLPENRRHRYTKVVMELEALDFKTRDDVLAYLTENGIVEVEREQTPYYDNMFAYDGGWYLRPDASGAEFVDVPHYYSEGAKTIRFFRSHKLNENDQEIEVLFGHYSGYHLYVFECVWIEFNTDGTISSMVIDLNECRILGEKME